MSFVTVLTPTYNRATLLQHAFDSLREQTCKDFEWLIVDDGSSDGTEALIRDTFKAKPTSFDIRYIKKPNGGKHTAVNIGVKEAKGSYIIILDSDDELTNDAIETIKKYASTINSTEDLGGMAFLMEHRNGDIINKYDKQDTFCSTSTEGTRYIDASPIDIRYKYKVQGDLCEVFRAEVLRQYPFPEIEGEKFCPEVLVWNRIGLKYKLRYFEKVIYKRDYLEGGLTSKMVAIRRHSPRLACMCYKEMAKLNIPFLYKVKARLNYLRYKINIV